MGDILNKKARNKIKDAIEDMNWKNPTPRKKLKQYLRPILYNYRDLIIKTRLIKLTKEQEEIFRKELEEAEQEEDDDNKVLEEINRMGKNKKKSSR